MHHILLLLFYSFCVVTGTALPPAYQEDGQAISPAVFESLEELARIVDIAYCVGTTGIQKPFTCLSRCSDFKGFELVTTWNTGPLLSDSCGYIAVSHAPYKKRIIVAFRGTYSIANTIADLSTTPAEYAPFPANGTDDGDICVQKNLSRAEEDGTPLPSRGSTKLTESSEKCDNCTVHSGFMTSWRNTRCTIIPFVERALKQYPEYELTLVGHSLGGAVAALAALEFQARGWTPHVTTFGEPKIGNRELSQFIDRRFNLSSPANADDSLYRRVTHAGDPVPLLPLQEWGYRMHAGEIFISKSSLPPVREDLQHCNGDEDSECISSGETAELTAVSNPALEDMSRNNGELNRRDLSWHIPNRYRFWQLFFAHRDYFWRLGLCVPGGDPWDWKRPKYEFNNGGDNE